MKKISIYIYALASLSLVRCDMMVNQELNDDHQLAIAEEAEKGIPVLNFNKGMIEGFNSEIYSWWAGDKIALVRKGDTLKVTCKEIGPEYTPFGRQINPLDFTESEAIMIRARAEGKQSPVLRIDLKDVNGLTANANAPAAKIKAGGGYEEYYFVFKDKWKQGWPSVANVDRTLIAEMMFFINPGGPAYTGTLYIDDIKAIKASEVPEVKGSEGGVVDDFSTELYSWWSGSSKIGLGKLQDTLMLITCTGAGPAYEAIGRGFERTDMTKTPLVRVSAKVEEGAAPVLRLVLKDANGMVTNGKPIDIQMESGGFKDYYFDYTGKYVQSYPDDQTVNPEQIQDLLIFINPGGAAYNGKILIEEIEILKQPKN